MLLQSKFCWALSICGSLTCHWRPHTGGDIRRRSCTIHPAFPGCALGCALSKDSPVVYGLTMPWFHFSAWTKFYLWVQHVHYRSCPWSHFAASVVGAEDKTHQCLPHLWLCVHKSQRQMTLLLSLLKIPTICFTAKWKLLSTGSLCSCLVHKVRESSSQAWLRENLPKKLRTNSSFWLVNLSVVASTKKGQTLVAGSRWGNTGPSLPIRRRTCSTLRWNQSHFPKHFVKLVWWVFLSSGRYRIIEQPRFEGAL